MPCHNAGRWVTTALHSIAQQTYPAHEIIIVDDDSTDDSREQIRSTGMAVKLLSCNARNAAVARNIGIEAANSSWIALLDADDVWYPNHLARAVKLLSETDEVAFMSNHDWIDLDGQVIPIPEEMRCRLVAPTVGLRGIDYFTLSKDGFHFGHSTVLYRRDRVREVGMFDPAQKRRHDIDLWLRVITGRAWTYDTVKSVGYREGTPGSLSKDEIECDYYYLRALVKNLQSLDCPPAREHLARQAQRAMGIAFVSGTMEQYTRIRKLAWPHLSTFFKIYYSLGVYCSPLLRIAMRARRRIIMTAPGSCPSSSAAP
jgi:glycosyltransferase involved in cell wall biosynthesis